METTHQYSCAFHPTHVREDALAERQWRPWVHFRGNLPRLVCPRGRVSRKAMETIWWSVYFISVAYVREDALAERQWRPGEKRSGLIHTRSRPRGRVSRKAMETTFDLLPGFSSAMIVREDALAERQWRQNHPQ